MKTPFLKQWLAAALCVLALGSRTALAESDSFGLGSGRDGPLTVAGSGTLINSYAPVTAALAAGSTSIPIGTCTGASGCFAAGQLVMVYQATGLASVPASGTQTPVDLGDDPVGRWELARLASVNGSTLTLTLTAPLVHAFAADVTQVIRVPEYTTVTVSSGQSITAPAWDGSTGGIVAFLATGGVNNAGQINASELGFRGGQYVADSTGRTGCSGVDEPAPTGAQKGEGVVRYATGAPPTGRGNVANGAGGGVCLQSGGGGGGNGGAGGLGGRSEGFTDGSRDVGGLGGTALTYSALNHFTFGGGGGAGHGGSSATGAPGGRGGGAIFIRARQLTGTGSLTAAGGSGGASASNGSGGGAGGSIYLRFVDTADCASISASGGIGGSVNAPRVGPGGGGGGGRVLFQSAGGSCTNIFVSRAASGTQQDPSDSAYGAQPGSDGAATVLPGGFVVPPPPTVSTPANGSVTTNRRPFITGTSVPGATVIIYLDGVEVGFATVDASGNFSLTPTVDLPDGPHTVQAIAEVEEVRSERSATNTFTVDTSVPDTFIVSGPPARTQEQDATFEFSSNEPDATFECSLDEAPFTACPQTVVFTGLAEGSHTLQVRARDAAGNVDETPASRTFRITNADYALLGSGCSATGGDASLVLMGLGTFAALARRRRRAG